MGSTELLADAFERVRDGVHPAANGLTLEELTFRPDTESNPIGWLVWHLTRIQDDHVAHLRGAGQRWLEGGWADRFALPLDPADTGYGHDAEQVGLVVAESAALLDYFEDVHATTQTYLATLSEADLERVVDTHWNPPITVKVRLVSVIADDLQHVGQAAYLRGIVNRR
ncbi:MAG TPA: DUF664 domain-containing protein [Acidimicrobiales bacterium]